MFALALLALALQQTEALPPAHPAPPSPAAPAPAPARAPRPARAPAAKAEPPAAREQPVMVGFDRKSGKRFSADFDDEDVEDALRQIADAASWSIVLPSGRHGTISAHFKNVPVEDALRAVLQQADLTASRDGEVITVRAPALLPGLSRTIGKEIDRATAEAMREAEKAKRSADREMHRAEREMRGKDRGDKVVHGDVVVHPDQPARDVVAILGSIKIEPGARVRDAVAIMGSVVLEPGARARGAVAIGGGVKLGSGARVDQDVVSMGGTISRDPGAEVGGEEVSIGSAALPGIASLVGSRMLLDGRESTAFTVGQVLAKFVVFFALGLLVLALFPRRIEVVATTFTSNPWKAIFTGLLGVVALPFLLLLLVATVIGIPLVPVAALLVVAAGVLGFTALASYVGRALPLRIEKGTGVLQLAIGTAILVLVTSIPLLGWMAWTAALLLTLGAVLRSRFGSQPSAVLPTTLPPPPTAPA